MKKFLLFLTISFLQLVHGQINFAPQLNHGFEPYIATLSGNGTIFYTTDGTDPNSNSTSGVNTVNINIAETKKVKAILRIGTNQWSEIMTKTFYFGPFPSKNVYFKKPETWSNACSFANSQDPQTTVDFFSGSPMSTACEGWFKATHGFFVGIITFNNCVFPPMSPIYQYIDIITENTVYYDYSIGPITNPPACLLAVDDSKKVAMVKVFPNPVQDFITILSDKKFISYEIIDQSGRTIQSKSFNDSKIDVTQLTKGNYIIKLKSLSYVIDYVKFIKK